METELRLVRLEGFVEQLVSLCGGSFLDEFNLSKGLLRLLIRFNESEEEELMGLFKLEETDEELKRVNVRKINEQMTALQSRLDDDFLTKSEQETSNQEIVRQIKEIKRDYTHTSDLNETLKKLHESFMGVAKSLKEFTKEVEERLTEKITASHKNIEDYKKTMAEVVTRMGQTLNAKLTMENLDQYSAKAHKEMRELEDLIMSVRSTVLQQENSLQRLDEVILEKASKVDLHKTNLQFTEYYRKTDLDKRFINLNMALAGTSEEFKILQEAFEALKTMTQEMAMKQDKPRPEQLEHRIIKQQIQDLKTSITYKADRAEVLSRIETFADIEAIHSLLKDIDLNRRHIQMTAVMLLTTLRGLYTVGRDSKTSELKRREQLIIQVENLVSWINRFNTPRTSEVAENSRFGIQEEAKEPLRIRSPTPDLLKTNRKTPRKKTAMLPSIDISANL